RTDLSYDLSYVVSGFSRTVDVPYACDLSQAGPLARLPGMRTAHAGRVGRIGQIGRVGREGRMTRSGRWALSAVVLGHLAVNIVHGRAHEGAQVPLSAAPPPFVYLVILAGPLVGLVLSVWQPVAGAWMVAATMAGALVF